MSASKNRRIDLTAPCRLHVVGVGGPGMSSIAIALAGMNHQVSGSDIRDSEMLDRLRRSGVAVRVGHDASLVNECEGVTASPAIPTDNVEVVAATSRGVFFSRAEMLASICAVKSAIGIAGTHGKTTTSALLVRVMEECGLHPSFVVGGDLIDEGTSARWATGPWTIVEADESDGTHLFLPLKVSILTNVDIDHLDHFENFDAIVDSFRQFVLGVEDFTVICIDDPGCRRVLDDPRLVDLSRVITYGVHPQAQVQFSDVAVDKNTTRFSVELPGKGGSRKSLRVETSLRGLHNVSNITAVIALAGALDLPMSRVVDAISTFSGVGRRFQNMGRSRDVTFVDDYGHLPREIDAVLQAARSSDEGWKRIVAVFQPNRFNRMSLLSESYADCFQHADVVFITDIYASGTSRIDGVTGELVVKAIRQAHPQADVRWAPDRDTLADVVAPILEPGDLCISMGCGDIETLPIELLGLFGKD